MNRLIAFAERWLPVAVWLGAASIVAAMLYVAIVTDDERDKLAEQRVQLTQIIETQNRVDANRQARTAAAIDQVEALVADLIDRHHDDLARQLGDISAQLESLGSRPLPEPRNTTIIQPSPTTTTTTTTAVEGQCRGRGCRDGGRP